MNSTSFLIRITFLLFLAVLSGQLKASQPEQVVNNLDSLRTEYISKEGLEKATTLIHLVDYYRNINMDSSVYYANRLKALSDSLNFEDGKIAAITGLVNADFVRGNYVVGIERALPFLRPSAESTNFHLADLYLATGNCYGSLGLYTTGVEHYLESRKIFAALNAVDKLLTLSNNLGAYYIRMGNFESALEVFSNITVEQGNGPIQVTQKVNFGFIYIGLNDLDKAEQYFLEVLEMGDSDIETRGKAISSFKLGNLYSEKKQFEKALLFHERSLLFYSKLQNTAQTVNPLNGMAEVHLSLGNIEKAKMIAHRSEKIGKENQTLLELNQVTNLLSRIYASEGNFNKAYEYSARNLELNDSLNISKRNQEIRVLETEFRFKRREDTLMREQNIALRKQRYVTGGVAAFLGISLIFIFVVYRSKKAEQKANTRLENLNNDLEDTNRIKNQLFSIIAHDLRNPLSSLYGLVTLLEMKGTDQAEIEKLIPELVSQFKHTSALVNNLLNWARNQMEGYQVLPVKFDLSELIKSNINLLDNRFKKKDILVKYPKNSPIIVAADRNMIDIVILNLLSNSLKYSDKGDTVTVESSEAGDKIIISIKDTGMGIPENKLNLLFTNSFYSTSGTRNEKGTGLGLMLCQEFVTQNNGKIWVESEFGVGTAFHFSIPKG